MEIQSNNIQKAVASPDSKEVNVQTVIDSKQNDTLDEKIYPDTGVMRAYANIKSSERTVSTEDVINFIRETGCKFEARCTEFAKRLTDSDGLIKQDTFDWIKNGAEHKVNLFVLTGLVENSKENGKINHKVLDAIEPVLEHITSLGPYSSSDCTNIPKYFKDKDGKFNKDVIEIIKQMAIENPMAILRHPEYIVHSLKNKENEYDTASIEYYKEQKSLGRKHNEIQNEILAGKDKNGIFSINRLNFYNYFKNMGFAQWQINKIQTIHDKLDDKSKPEFLEIAKTLNEDRDISGIFDDIENITLAENDKTGIGYNKKSIDFIKELKKEAYGRQKIVPEVLKKINIPMEEYTPERIKTIKSLFYNIRNESDIESLIDASICKNGEDQGKFSFENLERYLDIYHTNMNNIDEVKYISSILSLETNDRALETIRKLYNLSWEKESRFGTSTEILDRASLHFIFDLSTLSGTDKQPKRPFLTNILDNMEKLMEMHLPMTSAQAFENFMTFGEFDVIEKLEKVGLDEIGVKTGDITHGKFKTASEEELFAFKDYMKEYLKGKNTKEVEINLNGNFRDVVEISDSKYSTPKKTTFYNLAKKKAVAEMSIQRGLYNESREQKDFEKNTVVRQLFRTKKIKYEDYNELVNQTVERYDDKGKLLYIENMKESDIKGVYNVTKTYPGGRVEDIVKAQILPNGNELVEKNLVSSSGVRTIYRYEDDVDGNRIMDYKIVKPDGKVLMNKSITFEVLDENHFVTSNDKKKFDVKISGNTITVTNLNNNEVAEIDLVNFTNSTKDKILPLLKKIPGEELFKMKEFNLKSLSVNNGESNASYSPKQESIGISEDFLDEGVVLHEWGHGKDALEFKEINETISKDPVLKEIYEREKTAARERLAEAELEHLAYFGADYHYLGSDKVKEGIAESNILLNALPRHWVNAIRANYWMQEFPETIAYVSSLL